jgi:aryl-alcohol dehydrogenase-like predicted oxidoreductase
MRRIPEVALGANGPLVGVQGLGCMGMSEFCGARDDEQSLATLHHAVDRGVTLIDTADMYGQAHNERLIARLLKDRRREMVITMKFGFVRKKGDPGCLGLSNAPDHIRQSVDASLRRLGSDVIDLYYMHRRDSAVPLAESVGVMALRSCRFPARAMLRISMKISRRSISRSTPTNRRPLIRWPRRSWASGPFEGGEPI